MALPSFSTPNNATFLRVGVGEDAKGRKRAVLARRVKEGTPGAVQVFKGSGDPALDKDGNTVWRTEHPFIEGRIKKIWRNTPKYKADEDLCIQIETDDGSMYIIEMEKGDDFWVDFAYRAPAIDFSKPAKFVPLMSEAKDKDGRPIISKKGTPVYNRMMCIYQGGPVLKRAWKWGDPDGPPVPYFDEDEGKRMYGKRDKWLDKGPIEEAIKLASFHNNPEPTPEEHGVPGEGMDFNDIP